MRADESIGIFLRHVTFIFLFCAEIFKNTTTIVNFLSHFAYQEERQPLKRIVVKRFVRHIIALITLCIACTQVFALPKSKRSNEGQRVLIVSSYNPETPTAAATINDFVNYYNLHGNNGTVMIENMNCKSLSEASLWTERMGEIIERYSNPSIMPSVIILLGQEAWASYLSLDLSKIKTKIPVMCCNASRNIVQLPKDTCNTVTWQPESIDFSTLRAQYNIVGGNLYEYDIDKNIELILDLYPDTKHIALLTDNSYGGISLLAHTRKQMQKYKDIDFISLDGRKATIYSMSEDINKLPSNTVLLIGTWRVDRTESYYVKNSTHLLRDANNELPVFTLSSLGIGYWAIGGYVPMFHSQGKEMAKKAIKYQYQLKNGAISSNDELTIIGNHYMFDKNEISKRGLDFKDLPENIELVNDTPTFFAQYKYEIIAVAGAFIALLGILGIVVFFLQRNRRLTNALQQSQIELIHAKDSAEESNRMKTAFLANMSHEIRTPLNALVGFSEILTTDTTLTTADKHQISDIIQKNSDMLLNLINDVLDMARLESGRTKYITAPCDAVELCRDTLATCKTASRRDDIEYILETDMDSCMAILDEQHIRQVLINLMSNANKFTLQGFIKVSLHRAGDKLQFSVSDTGIGIPPEKGAKVFERFEKLNEMSQGFGIGLSLCKNIIEHFHGNIWIDMGYQEGARFIFTIPYLPAESFEGEESVE